MAGTGGRPGPLGVAPPPAGGLDLDLPGNGVRLAATRWPGEGTPVVLLHGLASQRRFWNLVAARLAGLPVLALDQRGHGDAERPEGPYDVTTVAADLATAMDAIGWSRAVVVGHSWGGAVAATFAAEHPERCLSLVVIDGGFSSPPGSHDRAAVRRRLEPPRLAMPPDDLVAMISNHSAGAWTEALAACVLPIFEVGPDGLARARLPFETHMQILDGLLDYDATTVLPRVRCASWLVSCEAVDPADEWTAHKRTALAEVVGSLVRPRVLQWAGAVHDVPLQWPDLVAGLIRSAVSD
jgi:pimeloyl-ACP methyl ester carboxylesterase